MAKKISNNILKVRNSVGDFQGVAAMCGESSYDIARRNGFSGTEADFLAAFAPDELVQGVTALNSQVTALTPPKTAAAHNAIYRGKDLTSVYTVEQICNMISAGTFDDLFIGDYFQVTINTSLGGTEVVKCVLADFDHFLQNGDTALTRHHAVVVPMDCFKTTAQMNASHTTEGGYYSTVMHQTTLPVYAAALQTALSNHILTYRSLMSNAMSSTIKSMAGNNWDGASSGWAWYDVMLRLMSEVNVYGCHPFSSSFYDIGANNRQFNLFRHNPAAIIAGLGNGGSRTWWWLSAVVNSTTFACVGNSGPSNYSGGAGNSGGVRPYFLIG